MKQVFIVMEYNGESYEDAQTWAVAAFSNVEDAKTHMEDLNKGYDNEYLDAKYPGVLSLDYSKHSFFVSEPVPFIK